MITNTKSKIADFFIVVFCVCLILVCVIPVWHIAVRSLSSTEALIKNKVILKPVGFNLDAYKYLLSDEKFTWSLAWTAMITVAGTVLSLFMTVICAYPLTFDKLKGRKFFNAYFIFTMFFNAGIIPMYLLLKKVRLINSPLVLVVPYCLSVFNMILMRSFMKDIPDSLRESAEIDGAGPLTVLWHIYLPLSKPVIATLALFYAVGRWNGYSDALMFMADKREFYPIQLLLYNLLQAVTNVDVISAEGSLAPGLSESLKAAAIMFATVPILVIYPWLQRYFITGVTLGAEKG